jgi:hypothetical protein
MRRLNIPELHESAWFPQNLRDLVTDSLQFILNVIRFYDPVSERLKVAVNSAKADRIVDLCSGGAGPWLWLHSVLRAGSCRDLEIVLTDKYPNLAAFENARRASRGAISYSAEPVEAAHIPPRLSGFRTVFSSLHHFTPDEVIAMLQDAADQRQGFGAFEGVQRRSKTIVGIVLVPIAAVIAAPFVRPFRVSRLFWSWILPVIPLVLFIDGVLSCLRAYSPAEMVALCEHLAAPGYTWDAGDASGRIGRVTYLLGYPATAPAHQSASQPNRASTTGDELKEQTHGARF